ncbi:STAS domain-containing protein [Kitasatospora sp. NPDC058190]|uniref:STAS domain-containing protein n=1 Tax=Kitasatospora sp. NPDC058190 TaxID=3346371 RepID=UPI0036D833CA
MSPRHEAPEDEPSAEPRLRIDSTNAPGIAHILRLHGEVDHGQRADLEEALGRAVKNGLPRLVVDLADLSFCDSTGLNALLSARLDALANSVRLILATPSPQVRRLLEITGADEVFTVRDSVLAALTEPTSMGTD